VTLIHIRVYGTPNFTMHKRDWSISTNQNHHVCSNQMSSPRASNATVELQEQTPVERVKIVNKEDSDVTEIVPTTTSDHKQTTDPKTSDGPRPFEYTKIGFAVNGINPEITSIASKFKHIVIPYLLKNEKLKTKTVNIIYSKMHGDGERVASKLLSLGNQIIISVGGDRMHYEVLNGILKFGEKKDRTPCSMGIIPIGSRNDIAKSLGFSAYLDKYEEIVDWIASAFTTTIDIGRITYTSLSDKEIKLKTYFLNSSSYGDSPSMRIAIEKAKDSNKYPKDLTLAREIKLKYIIDNQTAVQYTSHWGCITNGKYFAGGNMVSPKAHLSDSKLDMTLVADVGKWEKSGFEKKVKKGTHISSDLVVHQHMSILSLTPQLDTNVLIECEGELIGRLPARWNVVGKDLDFIVPEIWDPFQ
jgi:diacylglycerol kinase family enzyme